MSEKGYYIINPKGIMHVVPREIAAARLRNNPGYRAATKAQIEQYEAARKKANDAIEKAMAEGKTGRGLPKKFTQTAENPMFEAWTPEPPDQDFALPEQEPESAPKKAKKLPEPEEEPEE
jgi:hypothetical protein